MEFKNIVGIISVTDEQIKLVSLTDNTIIIYGDNLSVCFFGNREVHINGNIYTIET